MIKSLIIVFSVVLVGVYFTAKFFSLNVLYNIKEKDKGWGDFIEPVVINKKTVENDYYVAFKETRIGNHFTDFEIINLNERLLHSSFNYEVGTAYFTIEITPNLIDAFLASTPDVAAYEMIDKPAILKKYQVTSDLEFINLFMRIKNQKNNIFTSTKKMQEVYALQHFAINNLGKWDSISPIEGDYSGFILYTADEEEYHILKNNKRYIITFTSLAYFDAEKIMAIISTLEID